jgi:small subunit ribosomal protein S8
MVTDRVADMLTRIRNSYSAKHRYSLISFSYLNLNIARILKKEGYINDIKLCLDHLDRKSIYLSLKYNFVGKGKKLKAILTGIKRISRPGRRFYSSYKNFPNVLGNVGIAIISTSAGLMTHFDALKRKKGGEVLCFVW